jgi:nicotinate-nucleotide adenylyltransferase
MRRIGIFGGAFNPVHHAHLLVARAAQEALGLDEIVFVPCNRSAYSKKLFPAQARLRMLQASLRGTQGFWASDLEIRRGGISRSIDTVKELKRRMGPGHQFFLLIGADQVPKFPFWKDALQLSKLSKICVMARPGYQTVPLIHKKFGLKIVNVPQYEISSTKIRDRLKRRLSLKWLVPEIILPILRSLRS